MTLLEHDDDPVAERVRIALRQIASDGLRGDPVVAPIHARRHWVRPATIAAALVLALAVVALVVAQRDDGSTVVDDGSTGVLPRRVMPGPLPSGMQVLSVVDLDAAHIAENGTTPPKAAWARFDDRRVVGLVVLRVDPRSSERPVAAGAYNVEVATCPEMTISLITANVPEDALAPLRSSISCAMVDGEPLATVHPPDGFVAVAPIDVTPLHWTTTTFGWPIGHLELLTYRLRLDASSARDGWTHGHIGGRDLLVSEDGRVYRWEVAPGSWVDLSFDEFGDGGEFSADELAAFISGTRIVTDEEWQALRATVGGPPEESPSDGPSESFVTATTAAVASTLPAR
jgi:hypothetical protein